MSTRTILLLVADPQGMADIASALGDGWQITSVANEKEALAQLEQRAFDAILLDFDSNSPDASQVLNQALEKSPQTARFLLAYEADLALVAAYVSGPHEILAKPFEPDALRSRIERVLLPPDSSRAEGGSQPGTDGSASLAVPAVYAEVLGALGSSGVTYSLVSDIIARDAALTSEVLRLTESAHFGLPRNVTSPAEAVELLGLDAVKSLVMALRFLAEHSRLKPGYLSVEHLWQHSIRVALIARELMLFETQDRKLASEALVAGLFHDLGKVVLASNFDDLYGRVHSLARKQPVNLWDIEKEMFGATHGEIGGCLVGMWDMPGSVVQAVAYHHEPPADEQGLTPLAVVHIANALEHEIRPSDEYKLPPAIDTAFLNAIGLGQRLPVWRAVLGNRRFVSPGTEPAERIQSQSATQWLSGTPPPSTGNQLPAPLAETQTATSAQPRSEEWSPVASASRQKRWAYAGVAVVALVLLTFWIGTQRDVVVRAHTSEPTFNLASVVEPPTSSPEPSPLTVTEATPVEAVLEPALATEGLLTPEQTNTLPESEPAMASVAPENSPDTPVPVPPTEKTPQPEFRLGGIIYSVARPAAIVNGQTVFTGSWVSGAKIAAIDRKSVTLQLNERRIHLALQEAQ